MRAPLYSEDPGTILTPEAIDHPQRLYDALRRNMPMARIYDSGVHTVATWSLIEEVLGREDDFSANLTGVMYRDSDEEPHCFDLPASDASNVIATADEPDHAVHRAILQPRFLSAQVKAMEPMIRAWTLAALEPLIASGGGDVMPAAEQVPARAVAHLLGLPESDLPRHRLWAMMGGDILAGEVSGEGLESLATETANMAAYLGMHLNKAMETPDPTPPRSVLDILGESVSNHAISREQAVGIAIVLFGAGGESTAALIGSVLYRLAQEPTLVEQLQAKPELIPLFVEEIIRLEPPFKFHYRAVRRECQLAGYDLHPGDRLMLLWASANRDPLRFDDPDALRLDRRQSRQHLGFGRGAHFCLGAGLARLEAKIMVETLLSSNLGVECIPEAPPIYAKSIFVRRLETLPLRFTQSH